MKKLDNLEPRSLTRNNSDAGGKIHPPANYRVVIENDDKNEELLEFIEQVLIRVFVLESNQVAKIRAELLQSGRVKYGAFAREIAETKVAEIMQLANDNELNLECFIEKSA